MQYKFDNGLTASVINDGYGRDVGLYEMAVWETQSGDWKTNEIFPAQTGGDDVVGWLTAQDVAEMLQTVSRWGSV